MPELPVAGYANAVKAAGGACPETFKFKITDRGAAYAASFFIVDKFQRVSAAYVPAVFYLDKDIGGAV